MLFWKHINKLSLIFSFLFTFLGVLIVFVFIQNTKTKLVVKEFEASENTPTLTAIQTPISTMAPTPILILPTPVSAPTFSPKPRGNYVHAFVTFYGWPDNGPPPGNGIAYPKEQDYPTIHNVAGGVGTYSDPVSFASDVDLYPIGSLIYLPHIKKYAILEDLCTGCVENWQDKGQIHVDIWMESDTNFTEVLNKCMGRWTRVSVEIENDPPPGRPVQTQLLFNPSTGECLSQV